MFVPTADFDDSHNATCAGDAWDMSAVTERRHTPGAYLGVRSEVVVRVDPS